MVVHTQLNEYVKVIGSIPQLGNWDNNSGLILTTNESSFPVWQNEIPIKIPKH